jgi:hypothetical protein
MIRQPKEVRLQASPMALDSPSSSRWWAAAQESKKAVPHDR